MAKTSSYVKDTSCGLLSLHLKMSDILVSFGIPRSHTRGCRPDTKLLDPHLAQMAQACLNSTYFLYSGKFCEQTDEAVTAPPLSPAAVNLYMEHFGKMALETADLKHTVWLHCVDDL